VSTGASARGHGFDAPRRAAASPPPQLLLVLGAISQYAGAGIAVLMFDAASPPTVAWLRVLVAGVALAAWRRPWQRSWTRGRLALVASFGVVIVLMNAAFYLAIHGLALGTVVAIEFVGPVAVAAAGTRRRRDIAGLAALIAGVGLLSGAHLSGDLAGVAWALAAGGMWAGYIVLGHRVAAAAELRAQDGLAAALVFGALLFAPLFAWRAGRVYDDAGLAGRAVAVGLCSSVVPYALEQLAMRRLPRHRFAVMLALLPATATVMGAIVLGQVPGVIDGVGIALVIGAIWLTA
jgi:inner membrane transporter RhtA